MVGAARGMLHLHASRPPIIHRDLKSPNLLLDEAGRVKVTKRRRSRELLSKTVLDFFLSCLLGFALQLINPLHMHTTFRVVDGGPTLPSTPYIPPHTSYHPPPTTDPTPSPTTPPPPLLPHKQVADFNLSKVMEGSMASTVGGANNPRWMAPELLDGDPATPAADVFAFGVVMWEVLTWDIPWQTEQAFAVGVGGGATPVCPISSTHRRAVVIEGLCCLDSPPVLDVLW